MDEGGNGCEVGAGSGPDGGGSDGFNPGGNVVRGAGLGAAGSNGGCTREGSGSG